MSAALTMRWTHGRRATLARRLATLGVLAAVLVIVEVAEAAM